MALHQGIFRTQMLGKKDLNLKMFTGLNTILIYFSVTLSLVYSFTQANTSLQGSSLMLENIYDIGI